MSHRSVGERVQVLQNGKRNDASGKNSRYAEREKEETYQVAGQSRNLAVEGDDEVGGEGDEGEKCLFRLG